jgi:glycosyltransferase involved in cell wall biosynthesis
MAHTTVSAGRASGARQMAGLTEVQEPLHASPDSAGKPKSVSSASAKRRVLIIVENQAVPLDPRVWREARSLNDHGYQVTVLCPRRKGCSRGYEVIDGVHIYRHPMPVEGRTPLGYVSEYACAFALEFLYTSWIYLRRGFDVIQGCNPPDNIFLVALPFKMLGIKYIFDHHDANPELYVSKYGRQGRVYTLLLALEKWCYRHSDVVMATNESYRNMAISRGRLSPENVFVVRNGPDLQTFKPVPPNPHRKHGKRYLVGYVGNMNFQDGLDILLGVAKHVKEMGRHDVHFTCVGRGPELKRLQQMVQQMGLEDMVDFTGRVSDQDLIEILSTADVCVNPDRPSEMNDMSTMIKIMEYMALGKPIVQFECKEGRFSAQEASLYANKQGGDADFADQILWLLDRPEERMKMGEFGRKRVEEALAWEYSVPTLLAAYEEALRKGSGVAVGDEEKVKKIV